MLLGYVHRQFDELPERGYRFGSARKRHHSCHSCQPQDSFRGCGAAHRGKCLQVLPRRGRERIAPKHCHPRGFLERHDAGYRHGRLYQHGAPPVGGCPRSGSGFLHGRHRPPFTPCALPVQGGSQYAEIPYTGRESRGRHPEHLRRAGKGRLAGYIGAPGRRNDAGGSYRAL